MCVYFINLAAYCHIEFYVKRCVHVCLEGLLFLMKINLQCSQYTGFISAMKKLNEPKPPIPATRADRDIIRILAKIKGKVVRERVRVLEFLQDFDYCNEQAISRENFKRGLSCCRFDLNEAEVETVMNV